MRKLISIFPILFAALFAFGQPNNDANDLGSEEINIIKSYRPLLADAVKINFSPTTPAKESFRLSKPYTIPSKFIDLPYDAPDIKPLAYANQKKEVVNNGLLKVGFGTQVSPQAELHLTNGISDRSLLGLKGKYKSSKGNLIHQRMSQGGLGVYGKLFQKNTSIGGAIDYEFNHFNYYSTTQSDTSFTEDEAKRNFAMIGASIDLASTKKNKHHIDHFTKAEYYSLFDNFDGGENGLVAKTKIVKHYNRTKNQFFVNANLHALTQNDTISTRSGVTVNLNPNYRFDKFGVNLGLRGSWDSETFYVFPELGFDKNLIQDKLNLYNGWRIWLKTNSIRNFLQENPFLNNRVLVKNTIVEERYVGIKGALSKSLIYNIKLSQNLYDNLPLYVNSNADRRKFVVVYDDDPTMLNFHGELGYLFKEKILLNFSADYMNYEMENELKPWHLPSFQTNLSAQYKLARKITATGEIYYLSGAYGKLANGSAQKLDAIADINIGLHYKFSESFGIFLDVNNIANVKSEKWLNYPTYGFNTHIGLIARF